MSDQTVMKAASLVCLSIESQKGPSGFNELRHPYEVALESKHLIQITSTIWEIDALLND
jgi:hypothetical protein